MTGAAHETSNTHARKKGGTETCQFPLGFKAWTGVTSLSAGVFGKCRYLIDSANKVSENASTDANLSVVIIISLTELGFKVVLLSDGRRSRGKQRVRCLHNVLCFHFPPIDTRLDKSCNMTLVRHFINRCLGWGIHFWNNVLPLQ